MNVKNYREYSQHVIYYVTKLSRSSLYSLVDRGDNGGVSGSDVRVIETFPEHKVDIRGVDKYQISSIPLVNAEILTTNITGEVIVIMHQHACHGKNKIIHSSLRSSTTRTQQKIASLRLAVANTLVTR